MQWVGATSRNSDHSQEHWHSRSGRSRLNGKDSGQAHPRDGANPLSVYTNLLKTAL
jgi:hypothetical protein